MNTKMKLSRGVKKYIRRQKAAIRRQYASPEKQKEEIIKLYKSLKRLSK